MLAVLSFEADGADVAVRGEDPRLLALLGVGVTARDEAPGGERRSPDGAVGDEPFADDGVDALPELVARGDEPSPLAVAGREASQRAAAAPGRLASKAALRSGFCWRRMPRLSSADTGLPACCRCDHESVPADRIVNH